MKNDDEKRWMKEKVKDVIEQKCKEENNTTKQQKKRNK